MGIRELFIARRKLLAVIGLILVLLIALMLVVTRDHWWRKLGSVTVTYNGRPLTDSKIYRSWTGDVLIRLEELPSERQFYVIFIKDSRVGLPNENHFTFLPGFAYSKEIPLPVVFMGTAKAEDDPNLTVNDRAIAFTTLRGARVDITW